MSAGPPSRRIMLVDDNEDALRTLCLLFENAGYEVECVTDPLIALDVAKRFVPRVIVLDLGMPTLDGFALAKEIRGSAPLSETRLVALSGWGHDEFRKRAREAGFDRHLVKPSSFGEIRDTVEAMMR